PVPFTWHCIPVAGRGVVQTGPMLGDSSGAGSRRWFCRGFWGSETTCSPQLLVGEHVVKCRFTHTRTPPSERPPDPQPHWRHLQLNHARQFSQLAWRTRSPGHSTAPTRSHSRVAL